MIRNTYKDTLNTRECVSNIHFNLRGFFFFFIIYSRFNKCYFMISQEIFLYIYNLPFYIKKLKTVIFFSISETENKNLNDKKTWFELHWSIYII